MKKIKKRDLISFACVFCSSLIMAATTKTFVRPAHLLSGGFMGIALLVDMIADLFGKSIPTAFTLVALNVPVALICAKKISKRFKNASVLIIKNNNCDNEFLQILINENFNNGKII